MESYRSKGKLLYVRPERSRTEKLDAILTNRTARSGDKINLRQVIGEWEEGRSEAELLRERNRQRHQKRLEDYVAARNQLARLTVRLTD